MTLMMATAMRREGETLRQRTPSSVSGRRYEAVRATLNFVASLSPGHSHAFDFSFLSRALKKIRETGDEPIILYNFGQNFLFLMHKLWYSIVILITFNLHERNFQDLAQMQK